MTTDLRTADHVIRGAYRVTEPTFDITRIARHAHREQRFPHRAHIRMRRDTFDALYACLNADGIAPDGELTTHEDGSVARLMLVPIVIDDDVPTEQWQVCTTPSPTYRTYWVPTLDHPHATPR